MNKLPISLCALLMLGQVSASERALADSLAATASTLAVKGNTAAAKDMFYKALANDENCPDAIFELAKIFDKENNLAAASDFYQRASLIYAQENKPATTAKRAEADKRLRALNPFAPRLGTLFEEYAQDLDKLVKKVPDTVTQDSALARVNELKLPSVLTPEKLPKFYAAAQAQKTAETTAASQPDKPKTPKRPGMYEPPKIVNNVPPDVERELKAAGWTTITGTWVKKGPGLYETTDGKLEAPKINGIVDLWVHKGGTGSLRAAVRSDFNESSSSSYSGSTYTNDYAGYGISMRTNKEFRLYGPSAMTYFSTTSSRYEPSFIRSELIPESNPKNHLAVQIMDGVLELMINDKKSLRYKEDKIPQSGPFVIEVKGTMTLENPRCMGR